MKKFYSFLPVLAVLGVAFAIRLYACLNTPIINPDGPLYIYQAQAIYEGQWDRLTSCVLTYISSYPLLIAGAHVIFKSWVSCAMAVSVFFGTVIIIPVYLLLRRFIGRAVSLLSILVLALIPTLVNSSVEVIKDPVSWPFAAFGLLFFLIHLEGRNGMYLVASSCCFLAAASARVEVLLFLIVSCIYLVCAAREKRIYKLACFLAPIVLFALSAALLLNGMNLSEATRFSEVLSKFSASLDGYKDLSRSLLPLIRKPVMGRLELFLERARHLVWFVALGTLGSFLAKVFFYPFFAFFILGLKGIGIKIKSDPRIAFLSLLSACVLVLLYVHMLQTWVVETRFIVLFMIPAFVFLGFGLERFLLFLSGRFHMNTGSTIAITFLLIVAFSLPKNLIAREPDKISFRNIAEQINHLERTSSPVSVAASLHLLRWLSFYVNIHVGGAYCSQPYSDFALLVGKNYDEFVQNLRNGNMKYFVWEEKHWPAGTFDFNKTAKPEHFRNIGSWSHPDSGSIVLYQVLPK